MGKFRFYRMMDMSKFKPGDLVKCKDTKGYHNFVMKIDSIDFNAYGEVVWVNCKWLNDDTGEEEGDGYKEHMIESYKEHKRPWWF